MRKRSLSRIISIVLSILLLWSTAIAVSAADPEDTAPYSVELDFTDLGIEISPMLYGAFIEDINNAMDGGLMSQMVQNNSFQAYKWEEVNGIWTQSGLNTNASSGVHPLDATTDGKYYAAQYPVDPQSINSWTRSSHGGAAGSAVIAEDKPMNQNNTFCVKVEITDAGTAGANGINGYGLYNNGYGSPLNANEYRGSITSVASMPVKAGVSYDLSLFLQGASYTGRVKAFLEDRSGNLNSDIISFSGLTSEWKKFTGSLTAITGNPSRLVIIGDSAGTFWMDYIQMNPELSELWRDGTVGGTEGVGIGPLKANPEIAQAIDDLSPKFLRFPGGCASEGDTYNRMYDWKATVGLPEERKQSPIPRWQYWDSHLMGFYEYFLLSEALGAEPLPILHNGVGCQSSAISSGKWYFTPTNEEEMEQFYEEYVMSALDLIEFANGDVTTEWGAKRAALGHPEPFNLKYLGIGNENGGAEQTSCNQAAPGSQYYDPKYVSGNGIYTGTQLLGLYDAFWKNFDITYKEVMKKYPDMQIITSADYGNSGNDFNNNYKVIDELYPNTIVDEHYYVGNANNTYWFLSNLHRYNPESVRGMEGHTYDRSTPTRVFVGEYANSGGNNRYHSALGEAAFTLGLERNSDMVLMAAYAPLLCKTGYNRWSSNLIWFDNWHVWRSTNYYYQQLFSSNVGDRLIRGGAITDNQSGAVDTTLYTSPTLDTKTGTAYYKIVNADSTSSAAVSTPAKEVEITLKNAGTYKASLTYMASDDLNARNQPNGASTSQIDTDFDTVYDEVVTPQTLDLGLVSGTFTVTIPGNSINVLKLEPDTPEISANIDSTTEDSVSVTVDVSSDSRNDLEANLIAAVYNASGTLMAISKQDISLPRDSSSSNPFVLDVSKAGSGYYIKVFLWAKDGIPLTKALTL